MRPISRIILHHSASFGPATTRSKVHQWHLAKGWNGIGYHKFISPKGVVQQGRPDADIGAHAEGHNTGSFGVLLAGNYHKPIKDSRGNILVPEEWPPMVQVEAAIRVCDDLCWRHNLNPMEAIIGHRDVNDTACPGDNLYPFVPYIRERVAKLHADRRKRNAATGK